MPATLPTNMAHTGFVMKYPADATAMAPAIDPWRMSLIISFLFKKYENAIANIVLPASP